MNKQEITAAKEKKKCITVKSVCSLKHKNIMLMHISAKNIRFLWIIRNTNKGIWSLKKKLIFFV